MARDSHYGEHPTIQKHYVSMRSRSQPSILAFLAQDLDGQAFCYANADLRKSDHEPTILLTNDRNNSAPKLITRYAAHVD